MANRTWILAPLALLACVITTRVHAAPAAAAAELQNRTIQAFDRYVRLTEARLNGNAPFLWIDGLPETRRREALDAVRRRELSIERLETKDNGREIDAPGGMIHHWVGSVLLPATSSIRSPKEIVPFSQPDGVRILPLIASFIDATPLQIHNSHSGSRSG